MKKQQKEALVSDIKRLLTESEATFLVNYKGMDVPLLQGLRRDLRSEGGSFKVTKKTFMRIAAQDVPGTEEFSQGFKEQVALVFVEKDISSIAKRLSDFSKKNKSLEVISGLYESKLLSKNDFEALASLPSRDVLLALLLGTMQAPITGLARALHQIIARLGYVLKAIEEQKQEK